MPRPICLITGVGPGTGTAIARRFSEKYDVAMLARNRDRLANLRNENKNLYPYQCDVSDPEALKKNY